MVRTPLKSQSYQASIQYWAIASGPMMAHFKWYLDPLCLLSSIKKTFKKNVVRVKTFWIRALSLLFLYFFFLSDNSEVATAVIVSRGVENISCPLLRPYIDIVFIYDNLILALTPVLGGVRFVNTSYFNEAESAMFTFIGSLWIRFTQYKEGNSLF